MTIAPHPHHPLTATFAAFEGLYATIGSPSLHARRRAAFARFEAAGVPTTRDEEFKYTPLHDLERTAWQPAYGATVSRADLEATPVGKIDAVTLAFVNGEFAPELSSSDVLPAGVTVGSLREALEQNPEAVEAWLGTIATHEGKLGSTNDVRFVDLNSAHVLDGAYVHIARNVTVERPIHLLFAVKADHGPIAVFPRTLIVLGENAEAQVLESYVGLGGPALVNAVTEVELGANARLEHVRFQHEGPETIHLANAFAHQAGGSNYASLSASFGSRIARNDLNVWIDGEHTETTLDGAYCGTGEQLIDNHTRIDHAKPNCHSFEVYKGILADRAQGVFNGKIFVYEDAQKTDAKQSNQAVLLSPTASVNTKPQLEIFADDVKCTHGATVGQLREDALFYMRARGVPKKQAQALLVYAFAAEVLEKIRMDDVREALERVLFEKLGTGQA